MRWTTKTVRIREDELRILEAQAAKLGVTLHAYLRQKILQGITQAQRKDMNFMSTVQKLEREKKKRR